MGGSAKLLDKPCFLGGGSLIKIKLVLSSSPRAHFAVNQGSIEEFNLRADTKKKILMLVVFFFFLNFSVCRCGWRYGQTDGHCC